MVLMNLDFQPNPNSPNRRAPQQTLTGKQDTVTCMGT
jgi:hypothetical protein